MDIAEFLNRLAQQKNAQQNITTVGTDNINLNAYTQPTLGGNINAYQPTPVGLLSATLGKEANMPIYKDIALTNQNLRGGILSQADDVVPYGEYRDPNTMVKLMGGNNPNAMANYVMPLEDGRLSGGLNYSNQGLGVNAEYEKRLKEWLLRAGLNANPYEKQVGITLGREF
mgnify:FL=1|jgi:hypothetical protein